MRPPAGETRRRWKKLEIDLADRLEGWLTVGSGSKADKGDAKSYRFIGECKYRWACDENGFYMPLDLGWLETIWRHAARVKKVPLLALEWGNGDRACLIPQYDYTTLSLENYVVGEVKHGRTHRLPTSHSKELRTLCFPDIEVPEQFWILLPWEELSELRREELKLREELGKKAVSKFGSTSRSFPKRPFPTRLKK